ncbi:MAG: hypothetical protein P1U86_09920 [Verrucomicrobiales bacterium]|nr:hypothetical protein [Verrucomicrobiales bacterium]
MKAFITWFSVVSFFSVLTAVAAELDEFCVVQDSDGYTNVREKGDINSKVIARVDHGQLVWVSQGGMMKWPNVIFMDKEGKERTGFIHSSRLKALTDLETFTGEVSEPEQTETITKGDIKVKIQLEPFQIENRELTYKEFDEGQRYLIEIDGKEYWGTDGAEPRDQYRAITVQEGERKITLPDEALQNLFNPGLYPGNTKVTLNPEDDAVYITSFNSDGAGGYVVAFVIEGGKYKSRAALSPF